jgi:hypothetical protein
MMRPILFLAVVLSAPLAGCGGGMPVLAGGGAMPDEGIQTRSMRAAPATQRMENDSRPMSEWNTSEAIAARQAEQAPAAGRPAMPARTMPPSAMAESSAVAETEALLATSDPHQKVESFQKGAQVMVRPGTKLYARPSLSSEVAPLTGTLAVELGTQIYNANGYWYYISAGKESGWLSQSDIQR